MGHLVAVECENCSSELLLARIVKVFDTNIEVVWLDGEVAHHRDPQNRRKMVDWKDILPKSCIILFDFQFTSSWGVRWGSANTTTHITASICWHKARIIV